MFLWSGLAYVLPVLTCRGLQLWDAALYHSGFTIHIKKWKGTPIKFVWPLKACWSIRFMPFFNFQHFVLNVYPIPLDKITLKFSLWLVLNCQNKWFFHMLDQCIFHIQYTASQHTIAIIFLSIYLQISHVYVPMRMHIHILDCTYCFKIY